MECSGVQWELCPGKPEHIVMPDSLAAPDSTASVRSTLQLFGMIDTFQSMGFLGGSLGEKKEKNSLGITDSQNFISSSPTPNQFKNEKVSPREVR